MKTCAGALKWASANTRLIVAGQFSAADKVMDTERFRTIDQAIKNAAGLFSSLSGEIRACISAMLMLHGFRAADSETFKEAYRALIAGGFSRS
jgi:hypothetical protein